MLFVKFVNHFIYIYIKNPENVSRDIVLLSNTPDSGHNSCFAQGLELVWGRLYSKQTERQAPFSSKAVDSKHQNLL